MKDTEMNELQKMMKNSLKINLENTMQRFGKYGIMSYLVYT
mgnify:CR=1 FL=1